MEGFQDSLLERFNGAQEEAFGTVFKTYHRPLCFYTRKFSMSLEEAEDIVSEAFFRLFTAVKDGKRFETIEHIKNYLFTLTRNAAINQVNLLQRRTGYMKDFLTNVTEQEDAEVARNHRVETELLQIIYEAVESLPAECKKIFKLFYLENLSSQEIADQLSLHPQTVRNQKSRAIMLLRKYILGPGSMVAAGALTSLIYLCIPLLLLLHH